MSNELKLPLFVRVKDCGDMKQYDSIAAMQNDLEEIDVENGEYEAWDATGRPLALSVQKRPAWLRIQPQTIPDPKQLAEAIRQFARDTEADVKGLETNDFSGALKNVHAVLEARRRSLSMWHRFKQRF